MSPAAQANAADKPEKTGREKPGLLAQLREWLDALVVAYLLAMLIRVFVVEMYKIPSGSMTPTLLGNDAQSQAVSWYDVDADGAEDMILRSGRRFHVYYKRGERFRYAGELDPGPNADLWMQNAAVRNDQILVDKFAYWFSGPERGDIAVFKPPRRTFDPASPIFIKRVAALPGETVGFRPGPSLPRHPSMGYLTIDGERVTEPPFFQDQLYETNVFQANRTVPADSVYLFGDNTVSSRDSRYFGGVPLDNLRGRAIFRIGRRPFFLK